MTYTPDLCCLSCQHRKYKFDENGLSWFECGIPGNVQPDTELNACDYYHSDSPDEETEDAE